MVISQYLLITIYYGYTYLLISHMINFKVKPYSIVLDITNVSKYTLLSLITASSIYIDIKRLILVENQSSLDNLIPINQITCPYTVQMVKI